MKNNVDSLVNNICVHITESDWHKIDDYDKRIMSVIVQGHFDRILSDIDNLKKVTGFSNYTVDTAYNQAIADVVKLLKGENKDGK